MVSFQGAISVFKYNSHISVSNSINRRNNCLIKDNDSGDSFTLSNKNISFGGSIIKPTDYNAFVNKSKGIVNELAQRFPKDDILRRKILAALGLPEHDKWKLLSLIGPDELKTLLVKFDKTPEIYTRKTTEFGVDLHIHTTCSDGFNTPEDLLDGLSNYADRRVESGIVKSDRTLENIPFVFAVTDHNTLKASKDIIKIIAKNPYKHRNIGFVTGGAEVSSKYSSNILEEPISTSYCELLLYGANPFDSELSYFVEGLSSRISKGKEIKDIIKGLKEHNFEGVLGFAHPMIFFHVFENTLKNKFMGKYPADNKKHSEKYIKDMMNWFYLETKKRGIAGSIETHYQDYLFGIPEVAKFVDLITRFSRQTKLLHTGGTDNHGNYEWLNIRNI